MDTTQTTTTTQTVTRSRFKNATVIILFILLTVLAGVGIIVAINLQGSQAPDDSLAGGQDPKTGMWIRDNGECFSAETGGTLTGYFCGNGCEAARKCWTGAELNAFGGGCNAAYDALCQQATCAGDGAAPAPGQSCCTGLNLCGHGRCGVTCNGSIGGTSGSCPSGQWNLYECTGSCSTAGGCQTRYTGPGGSAIIEDVNGLKATQFVNGTAPYTKSTTCYVRQADCVGTSGVNLVFRSSYSCSNQCSSTGGGDQGGGDQGGGDDTGSQTLYCGDAICGTNEKCERVSPGANTFRACRAGDVGSAPGGATVADCYRIADAQTPAGEGARCKYCGDGLFHPNVETCDPTAPAENGNTPDTCSAACKPIIRECIGANKSTSTLAPGAGNKIIFTLRFKDDRENYPYDPGITARVSSSSSTDTAVGRDAHNTASTLVSLIPGAAGKSRAQQSDGSYIYEYKFEWEAATTGGQPVGAGNYTVEFLNNGNPVYAGNQLCKSSITLSVTQVENPVFSIVKTSAPVCESDNDSRIDYTVRVTNSGPVEGVIDSVVDTLDAEVIAAGIVPTNIVPTYGTYATGKITWLGTVADRTYAAGQSKDFTYSLTIPAAQVASFTGTGIDNQVVVTYDTSDSDDNTDSFTLNTPVACSTPPVTVIPETGIFDDGRFLILGALFVLTGIYVYRRQFILEHSFETEIERKLSRKADGQD